MYFNIVHQISDGVGHGVIAFRKCSHENQAIGSQNGITQIEVSLHPEQECPECLGTPAPIHWLDRPR